jgi:hypothetical protein
LPVPKIPSAQVKRHFVFVKDAPESIPPVDVEVRDRVWVGDWGG